MSRIRYVLPLATLLLFPTCAMSQTLDNPLAPVLNHSGTDLSTLGITYQEAVQPGAVIVIDQGGKIQFPDPVPALDSMKVINEAPHLPHSSINIAKSMNFFLSLLGYDPSAKLLKAGSLEVFETDFTSTRIRDGQMEDLVYRDPKFAEMAKQVIRDGGVAYLIESVWLAKSLRVTQASSAGVALSTGKDLPSCTAQPAAQSSAAGQPAVPVVLPGAPPAAARVVGDAAPPAAGGTLAGVEAAATTSIKSLSNALTNAVNTASKAVAIATASPVQVGLEACRGQNSLLELTSTRPVPVAVKLQRLILDNRQASGLNYVGDVRNF